MSKFLYFIKMKNLLVAVWCKFRDVDHPFDSVKAVLFFAKKGNLV
jgi:hypothetical protein